jgi:hypothetical protein
MALVATITELEVQLSKARDAAASFLEECTRAIEAEEFSWHEFPVHLAPRARELSAGFHAPLVRVSSLVRQSLMFGNTDFDAMRIAIRRIDGLYGSGDTKNGDPKYSMTRTLCLALGRPGSQRTSGCRRPPR